MLKCREIAGQEAEDGLQGFAPKQEKGGVGGGLDTSSFLEDLLLGED